MGNKKLKTVKIGRLKFTLLFHSFFFPKYVFHITLNICVPATEWTVYDFHQSSIISRRQQLQVRQCTGGSDWTCASYPYYRHADHGSNAVQAPGIRSKKFIISPRRPAALGKHLHTCNSDGGKRQTPHKKIPIGCRSTRVILFDSALMLPRLITYLRFITTQFAFYNLI